MDIQSCHPNSLYDVSRLNSRIEGQLYLQEAAEVIEAVEIIITMMKFN